MRYFNMCCHPPLLGNSMIRSEELEANTLLDKAEQAVSNLVDHDRRRQRHVQNSLPVLLPDQCQLLVLFAVCPSLIHTSLCLESVGNT
jgi:hypothetical protein